MPDEDDELDGCDIDFEPDSITDEEAELLPLFPEGTDTSDLEAKRAEWEALFGGNGV